MPDDLRMLDEYMNGFEQGKASAAAETITTSSYKTLLDTQKQVYEEINNKLLSRLRESTEEVAAAAARFAEYKLLKEQCVTQEIMDLRASAAGTFAVVSLVSFFTGMLVTWYLMHQ